MTTIKVSELINSVNTTVSQRALIKRNGSIYINDIKISLQNSMGIRSFVSAINKVSSKTGVTAAVKNGKLILISKNKTITIKDKFSILFPKETSNIKPLLYLSNVARYVNPHIANRCYSDIERKHTALKQLEVCQVGNYIRLGELKKNLDKNSNMLVVKPLLVTTNVKPKFKSFQNITYYRNNKTINTSSLKEVTDKLELAQHLKHRYHDYTSPKIKTFLAELNDDIRCLRKLKRKANN